MSFESDIRDIKRIVSVLTGKESDVHITFKGNSHGVTKPWLIQCNSREINHEKSDDAARQLLSDLKKELVEKISKTKKEAAEYEKVLGGLQN